MSSRFTRKSPCPICGGGDDMPRGQGLRCHGWLSDDGLFAHCSRVEVPNRPQEEGGTWPHALFGTCDCGARHAPEEPIARVVAEVYDYRDESGNLFFQVVRYAPKDFRQRRPLPKGGWKEGWAWHLKCDDSEKCRKQGHEPIPFETERVIYRLPELVAADHAATVLIAEGEKDVDRLRSLGYVATCNPGGAGKWRHDFALRGRDNWVLKGRAVVIIADADEKGRKHAQDVAASLAGFASSIAVLELPGAKDASEFFDKGGTVEQLDSLIAEAPAWTPRQTSTPETPPATDPGPPLQTIDQALASMPPPGERLSSGIPTLDRCSRGGLARGMVYTVVGPPGKGKTALIAQLCRTAAAEHGARVLGFFHDEGSWQAGMMMAEACGFDRDELEMNYAGIRQSVQIKTDPLQILLAPHGLTLDDAEEWLGHGGRDVPAVVGIDSVQKVRPSKNVETETRKDHADAVMSKARRLAALGAVVLIAAKANRASWSKKKTIENIDPLAAGLDSSSIEYDSDAFFFLQGDPGTRSFLSVHKNRPGDGTQPTIALGFDRSRATFREIDPETAANQASRQERERDAAKWSADERRVLEQIRETPGRSQRMLRELLHMNTGRLGAVLEELARKGKIVDREGWFLDVGVSDDDEAES